MRISSTCALFPNTASLQIRMIIVISYLVHLVSSELTLEHSNQRDIEDESHWLHPGSGSRKISDESRPIFTPLTRMRRTKLGKTDLPAAVVIAQTGSRAVLHCDMSRLNDLEDVTVKWFKRNKISRDILTLMDETVHDDKRFLAIYHNDSKDWSLHIRYTQPKDKGLYQCQICTNGTTDTCNNVNTTLKLVEAYAKIIDGPIKIIPAAKELPLRLSCVLINSIEAPEYIFWYHDDRMINYDLEDDATVREGRQGSELIFPKANKFQTGNYSCVPSNAHLDSVMVYYGEKGVLTHRENGSVRRKFHPHHIFNMLLLVSTLHLHR